MTVSAFQCQNCGSTDIRRSRMHSLVEWLQAAGGTYPFRCLRCNQRFSMNIWLWSRLAFAKCPKCLRPELTNWPAKYYRLPLRKSLLVTFGAHRYRCTGCRYRFVSFRPAQTFVTDAALPTPDDVASDEMLPVRETENKP